MTSVENPSGWTAQIGRHWLRMKTLPLQVASRQFSAVAARAAGGEPQMVTKHGRPYVLVVSFAEWKKFRPSERPLIDLLRSCPVDLTELKLDRTREPSRDLG